MARELSIPSGDEQQPAAPTAHIKRPPNAFICYRTQRAKDAREKPSTGGMRQATVSQMVQEEWNKMSPEQKAPWHEIARQKKLEHERKYPNYKYKPGPRRVVKEKQAAAAGHGEGGSKVKREESMAGNVKLEPPSEGIFAGGYFYPYAMQGLASPQLKSGVSTRHIVPIESGSSTSRAVHPSSSGTFADNLDPALWLNEAPRAGPSTIQLPQVPYVPQIAHLMEGRPWLNRFMRENAGIHHHRALSEGSAVMNPPGFGVLPGNHPGSAFDYATATATGPSHHHGASIPPYNPLSCIDPALLHAPSLPPLTSTPKATPPPHPAATSRSPRDATWAMMTEIEGGPSAVRVSGTKQSKKPATDTGPRKRPRTAASTGNNVADATATTGGSPTPPEAAVKVEAPITIHDDAVPFLPEFSEDESLKLEDMCRKLADYLAAKRSAAKSHEASPARLDPLGERMLMLLDWVRPNLKEES